MQPYRKQELPRRLAPVNRFWTGRILAKVRPKIKAQTIELTPAQKAGLTTSGKIPKVKSSFSPLLMMLRVGHWLSKDNFLMETLARKGRSFHRMCFWAKFIFSALFVVGYSILLDKCLK